MSAIGQFAIRMGARLSVAVPISVGASGTAALVNDVAKKGVLGDNFPFLESALNHRTYDNLAAGVVTGGSIFLASMLPVHPFISCPILATAVVVKFSH